MDWAAEMEEQPVVLELREAVDLAPQEALARAVAGRAAPGWAVAMWLVGPWEAAALAVARGPTAAVCHQSLRE